MVVGLDCVKIIIKDLEYRSGMDVWGLRDLWGGWVVGRRGTDGGFIFSRQGVAGWDLEDSEGGLVIAVKDWGEGRWEGVCDSYRRNSYAPLLVHLVTPTPNLEDKKTSHVHLIPRLCFQP